MTKLKSVCWVVALLFLSSAVSIAGEVKAPQIKSECSDAIKFGGVVPDPFKTNVYGELANGEKYVLKGMFYRYGTDGYLFKVDLEEHTWLASKKKTDFPFYPVDVGHSKDAIEKSLGKTVYVYIKSKVRAIEKLNDKGDDTYYSTEVRIGMLADPTSED